MAYYTSATCGRVNKSWVSSGCTTAYNSSEIKYVVEAWAAAKFTDELKEVNGYSARLIQYDEIEKETREVCSAGQCDNAYYAVYDWMYNSNYWYWTMTPYARQDQAPSSYIVWNVNWRGILGIQDYRVYDDDGAVRPVINVYKSAIQS